VLLQPVAKKDARGCERADAEKKIPIHRIIQEISQESEQRIDRDDKQ
jgi:hypothetical protein